MVIQSSYLDYQKADGAVAPGGTAKRDPQAMKHGLEFTWGGLVAYTGAIFFVGWISSAGYFQVAGHWQTANQLKHVETQTIPAIKSIAGCQEKRASVLSGQSDDSLPNCPSIRSAPRVPSAK